VTNKAQVGGLSSEASPRQKNKTLTEKQLKQKGLVGMVQVAEHLPNKLEALSSNHSTMKKKKFLNITHWLQLIPGLR
jgi:hypothetical protein